MALSKVAETRIGHHPGRAVALMCVELIVIAFSVANADPDPCILGNQSHVHRDTRVTSLRLTHYGSDPIYFTRISSMLALRSFSGISPIRNELPFGFREPASVVASQ